MLLPCCKGGERKPTQGCCFAISQYLTPSVASSAPTLWRKVFAMRCTMTTTARVQKTLQAMGELLLWDGVFNTSLPLSTTIQPISARHPVAGHSVCGRSHIQLLECWIQMVLKWWFGMNDLRLEELLIALTTIIGGKETYMHHSQFFPIWLYLAT